ncbi:MAG TPA: TlpA disulfide reductase family protein [Cyclobacteriaceae bacterium]|nr:TlpA disulfide reductase family protein [Cyclobacteriaceae bacterium]
MILRTFLKMMPLLMILSCTTDKGAHSEEITIRGKINKIGTGSVYLEHINGSSLIIVDTIAVNSDGTYFTTFKPDEPGYFRMNFYNTQFVTLLLSDESIELNVDGNSPKGWFEVKGSTPMIQLTELNRLVAAFNNEAGVIDEEFREAYTAKDEKKMEELRNRYMAGQEKLNKDIKSNIRNMGTSLALIQAVNFLDMDNDFQFIDSVARVVEEKIPDYRIKNDFVARIDALRKLSPGAIAPEIELPDQQGNLFSLSSLRGKYVLIDFWAAWCGPCRRENPNVVKLYNKYKGPDFEILGVSLDRKKEDWIKAIQDDSLMWKHVSDLQYFNSKAARDYSIDAIPATYLIDREGKIIEKNLRGKSLEEKLAELFGS